MNKININFFMLNAKENTKNRSKYQNKDALYVLNNIDMNKYCQSYNSLNKAKIMNKKVSY